MTHIAAGLFFALVLIGAAAVIRFTLREYWQDILAALRGDVPVREVAQPWTARVRVTTRPRPVATRAAVQLRRAAS